MSLTPLDRFLVLLATGLGLLLIGVLNLSLRQFQVRTRVALVTAAQVGLLAGFACCLADFKPLWYSGVLLFTVVLAWAILCTPLLAALRRRAARFFFLRGACWPALSVLGLGGVLASVGTYAWDDDTAALEGWHTVQATAQQPPLALSEKYARTDQGTKVSLMAAVAPRPLLEAQKPEQGFLAQTPHRTQLIRREAADDHANCHGWVFTGGRYWLSAESVERILCENGYEPVDEPRPGDLVIYREEGQTSHTAVVRYVTEGMPVLVEGKWGPFGVYLHPVEQSGYGTDFTFYRSARVGHLLQELHETDAQVAE